MGTLAVKLGTIALKPLVVIMSQTQSPSARLFAWIRSWDTVERGIALGAAAWIAVGTGFYFAGSDRDEMMGAGFVAYIVVLISFSIAVFVRRKMQHRMAHRTPSPVSLNRIPLVASVVMLLMATGGDWPHGFYQLLRMVVCGTGIYVVIQTSNHHRYWPWIVGGIAVLFNPILPISFTKEEWRPVDFAVAIIFLVALVQMRQRK